MTVAEGGANMVEALQRNPKWQGRRGPVVLVIMDGVGYGKYEEGDAAGRKQKRRTSKSS